jgi:hypothetical protein
MAEGNSNGLFFPSQGNGAYLILLRVGFTKLSRSLGIPVSSYLAFSPLPTEANASEFGV